MSNHPDAGNVLVMLCDLSDGGLSQPVHAPIWFGPANQAEAVVDCLRRDPALASQLYPQSAIEVFDADGYDMAHNRRARQLIQQTLDEGFPGDVPAHVARIVHLAAARAETAAASEAGDTGGREPAPETSSVGDDTAGDLLPAEHFVSTYGMTADQLRKAVGRGRLKRSEKRENGWWYHSESEVRDVWRHETLD